MNRMSIGYSKGAMGGRVGTGGADPELWDSPLLHACRPTSIVRRVDAGSRAHLHCPLAGEPVRPGTCVQHPAAEFLFTVSNINKKTRAFQSWTTFPEDSTAVTGGETGGTSCS